MPRLPRKRSESGYYHIILRSVNRYKIFRDDQDCLRFLDTVNRYKDKSCLEVIGWCLMINHIHLLVQEGHEDISLTMKRIGVSFSRYYHAKYNTVGHLFQDRFKSEAVEDDQYLLTAIRYIHQNPVKAGLVDKPAEWIWSSCQGYYGEDIYPPGMLNSNLILGIMDSNNHEKAIVKFTNFNEKSNNDFCMDYNDMGKLSDEEAKELINSLIPNFEFGTLMSIPKTNRDELLAKIKSIDQISQRQAARILGVSPNLLFKAKRGE